jgi:hypothetical protein
MGEFRADSLNERAPGRLNILRWIQKGKVYWPC